MAIAPLAVKDNILYIAASTLAADFTTPNDLSFRVTPKADAEVIPAISYFESKKISRVGILYMNNEIGTSLKNALVGAVKNSSVKIVAEEVFAADSVDFRTTLLKLKNAGIDGLYLGALASHTSVILKQANDIKMTVPMVSYRAAEDTVLLKNAGTLANGLLYTNTYDSANQDSENKKFVALYKEKYQEEPNAYAAEAYEAVRLIADTYVKCGDTIKSVEAQECSKAFLFSVKNRSSVFGPLSFDMNGDVTYPFFMKTIKDGKFVRYEGQ
jgi:branched-chain amino acid transport system substrate-binding protein